LVKTGARAPGLEKAIGAVSKTIFFHREVFNHQVFDDLVVDVAKRDFTQVGDQAFNEGVGLVPAQHAAQPLPAFRWQDRVKYDQADARVNGRRGLVSGCCLRLWNWLCLRRVFQPAAVTDSEKCWCST
jgi:hypothetical protein